MVVAYHHDILGLIVRLYRMLFVANKVTKCKEKRKRTNNTQSIKKTEHISLKSDTSKQLIKYERKFSV